MAKEMKRLIVHVYGHEFEVNMSKEKEHLYLLAAEYVNKKINAYMDAFVRKPLPQKSSEEIMLMAMLDIAIGAIECKQNSVHSSLLEKIKNKYFSSFKAIGIVLTTPRVISK